MSIRADLEGREAEHLASYAARSRDSKGRLRPEAEDPIRPAFQRDRDRIVHSKAFRRLKHKTQVFFAPTGDHYRTRLTHTLEMSQIARTVAKVLRLNEELTEAIALGHDLGHTPFGHAGERVLNDLMPGGFSHYEQSLRVVDVLEQERQGLNLTWEVRDGIAKHSKGKGGAPLGMDPSRRSATLEGQVARVADMIAYVNHDIDDAMRAGVLDAAELPAEGRQVLGRSSSERIGTLVSDIVERPLAPRPDVELRMSDGVLSALLDFERPLHEAVAAPRIHLEGGLLSIEPGFEPAALKPLLEEHPNHKLFPAPNMFFGGTHVASGGNHIAAGGPGGLAGAGDPRRGGVSVIA